MTIKLKTPPMPEPEGLHMVLGAREPFFEPTYQFTEEQLAARDAQWLELVGPVVEALKEAQQSLQTIAKNAGKRFDSDGQDNLLQHHDQVRGYAISRATAADASLRAITEEQE